MKKLSLFLAIIMLFGTLTVFAGCSEKETDKKDTPTDSTDASAEIDTSLPGLVAAINEKLPYEGLISRTLYKEEDEDELGLMSYGLLDLDCYENLTDYVITLPSDYSQTLAMFVFNDEMTDEDFKAVQETVNQEYVHGRASSLQMYKPEEYADVCWALEHTDKIWRQYGNMLVLVIYGGSEPTAAWDVLDAALGK